MLLHTARSPRRCSSPLFRDRSTPPRSRLLVEPFRHPALRLFLALDAPLFDVFQSAFDLLAHVNVILDILVRHVVRKALQHLPNFFLRCTHVPLQPPAGFLTPGCQPSVERFSVPALTDN